jgi:hypothetical protein
MNPTPIGGGWPTSLFYARAREGSVKPGGGGSE